MTITTIDEEIAEVHRAKMAAHHGAAQAKVLAMRLRAAGDRRGADLARQVALKMDGCVEQFGHIEGDLSYRKQLLITLAADRVGAAFVSQFRDHDDFLVSQAEVQGLDPDHLTVGAES